MTADREKDLFYEALELKPADRDAFLRDNCDDTLMIERICSLLEAHEGAQEFMSDPTMDSGSGDAARAIPENVLPGAIGPYTPLSLLGEGGFGRVFLAEQNKPISRIVALKVLKAGMDSRAIIGRFEAERQALAVMDHPNVARVLDGGQTLSGHPYFVMEYIRGEPITEFCQRHNLSLRRRLELFEMVCLAVQHAHHKGIIHRDLKPSNVLVTMVDNQPVPKVIDFGIAKAIGNTDGGTLMSIEGQMIGTPAYMSPEQVRGAAGMDTRSDVYTLGVLLYELLAGGLPFEKERIDKVSPSELAEMICEEIPPKPSTRINRVRDSVASQTRQLGSQLRGDLDWIVMRALEKEPGRRYQTANSFAGDIRRYLRDEAVEAGPPSSVYRFRKFAQRHRGELAASGLILTALVAGLVSSLIFAARIDYQQKLTERELERSKAFASFATNMLSGLDPAVARGQDTGLFKRMLEDSEQSLKLSPPEDPLVEAEMRELLGVAHYKVADYPRAEQHFITAITLAESSGDKSDGTVLSIATMRNSLASVFAETTRFEEAREELGLVMQARQARLGPDDPQTLRVMFDLGAIDRLAGNYEKARDRFETVLAARTRVLGEYHQDTMSTMNSLATVLDDLGEHERSVELLETVITFQLEELGKDHPHTLATRNNLADSLGKLGRHDESLSILEDVLAIKRRVLGEDHPSHILALNNLASTYSDLDRRDDAEPLLIEAYEISDRTLGERDMRTLILANNLSRLYLETGRAQQAKELLLPAIPIAEESLAPDHPLVLAMLTYKVGIHREQGDNALAIEAGTKLVGLADRSLPELHPARANHRRLLAEAYLDSDDVDSAAQLLKDALELHDAGALRDPSDLMKTLEALTRVSELRGQSQEAAVYEERLNDLRSRE